jgi:uncharacterized alkaline shock family protein YloU
LISSDVVARYAADAARDVDGVSRVTKGTRVEGDEVELHLCVRWGVSIPEVGAEVQRSVGAYLERMTESRPAIVNVVVDEVDGAP